jgi:glutamate synthase domain-containing protein 1
MQDQSDQGRQSPIPQPPDAQGLYDPQHEKAACGVGFVVHLKGAKSHAIVEQGLQLLRNLEHRGACGCEVNTGDGAGILVQMPDRFLRKVAAPLGIALPPVGEYGAGLVFLPHLAEERAEIMARFEAMIRDEGQIVLGWRDVPTDDSTVGETARRAEPVFKQIFIGRGPQAPRAERGICSSSASSTSFASGSSTRSTSGPISSSASCSTSSASPRGR